MTTEQHRRKIQELANRLWAAMEAAVDDGEVVHLNNINVSIDRSFAKDLMVTKK